MRPCRHFPTLHLAITRCILTALIKSILTLSDCCPVVKVYQRDEANWDIRDESPGLFTTYKKQSEKTNQKAVYKSEDGGLAIAFDGNKWNIQAWENR